MSLSLLKKASLITLCVLALSACKIRVEVPTGGYVETESGSFICHSGQSCDVDVIDIYFDEVFVAVPDEGMFFNGWKKRNRGLFGGSHDPAAIDTFNLAGEESMMSILESDEVFYLSPTFSSECTRECDISSITLYEPGLGFFSEPKIVAWPYADNGIISAQILGIPQPTTYSINTFELVAQGSDYTISNVQAYDQYSLANVFFDGLREGQIIRDGESLEFELISGLTGGGTAKPTFSFEILETGDTFQASYTFQSN
jgi:hypothetical protein